jgi:hypothetical protein
MMIRSMAHATNTEKLLQGTTLWNDTRARATSRPLP